MSELYLVRHGQASFGTDDYDRLSAVGREQTSLLGEHFRVLGRRVDALYSGPLRRQRETALGLAAALAMREDAPGLSVLDGLAEYDAGALILGYLARDNVAAASARMRDEARGQGLDRPAYQRLLEATGAAWIRGELAGHGESWQAFRGRVAASLDTIRAREGRRRVIVAAVSAGVIGAVLGDVLGLSDQQALAMSWAVHNSSVTLLRYDERRTALSSFNSVGHLERALRLDLLTYR